MMLIKISSCKASSLEKSATSARFSMIIVITFGHSLELYAAARAQISEAHWTIDDQGQWRSFRGVIVEADTWSWKASKRQNRQDRVF
jgi:hypothetical protein